MQGLWSLYALATYMYIGDFYNLDTIQILCMRNEQVAFIKLSPPYIINYICNMCYRYFSSKFDLYSKADSIPDMNEVSAYYQELVDKYLPGKISW